MAEDCVGLAESLRKLLSRELISTSRDGVTRTFCILLLFSFSVLLGILDEKSARAE